jgi:hypothetical protein
MLFVSYFKARTISADKALSEADFLKRAELYLTGAVGDTSEKL